MMWATRSPLVPGSRTFKFIYNCMVGEVLSSLLFPFQYLVVCCREVPRFGPYLPILMVPFYVPALLVWVSSPAATFTIPALESESGSAEVRRFLPEIASPWLKYGSLGLYAVLPIVALAMALTRSAREEAPTDSKTDTTVPEAERVEAAPGDRGMDLTRFLWWTAFLAPSWNVMLGVFVEPPVWVMACALVVDAALYWCYGYYGNYVLVNRKAMSRVNRGQPDMFNYELVAVFFLFTAVAFAGSSMVIRSANWIYEEK